MEISSNKLSVWGSRRTRLSILGSQRAGLAVQVSQRTRLAVQGCQRAGLAVQGSQITGHCTGISENRIHCTGITDNRTRCTGISDNRTLQVSQRTGFFIQGSLRTRLRHGLDKKKIIFILLTNIYLWFPCVRSFLNSLRKPINKLMVNEKYVYMTIMLCLFKVIIIMP